MKKLTLMLLILIVFSGRSVYGYSYGIPKSKNNNAPYPGDNYHQLITNNGGYYIGDTNRKEIYLTFDNGYENGYTNQVLDVLAKYDVPGIFFVTGHYIKSAPEVVLRMTNDGHLIGNHSYHHPDYTRISEEKMAKEINMLNDAYKELTGLSMSKFFRPPAGTFNLATLSYVHNMGYTNLFWSLAYKDWETNRQKGAEYAYEQIMKYIHPGAIVLMHTVSKDNAIALEKIIVTLREQGYEFKSVNALLK